MDRVYNKILVVDDQSSVCYSLRRVLESNGYSVKTTTKGADAISLTEDFDPDIVLMDIRMPGMDGLEVLRKIKETHSNIQVIMMTAYSTTEKAIEAMKRGAYDYLVKPFDNDMLLGLIEGAIKTKRFIEDVVIFDDNADETTTDRIVGKSPDMMKIYKQIGKIAPTDAPVLILGESGTGKELIARAIYHHSRRSHRPFLAVNCAAIPEHLLESELFGYEQGAFTGADFRRIGKFEQCDKGTIFLDEIGDMSLSLQAKLLRVLQDGCFQRLGGGTTIRTDVRIIAATNKDIETMVKQGTFREDLYYRINVLCIRIPPLRQRRDDIKGLIEHFINKYNRILGREIKGITRETLVRLLEYPWPGNVRELENVIQKAMVLCRNNILSLECCEDLTLENRHRCESLDDAINILVEHAMKDGITGKFQELMETIETRMVKKALELTGNNQVQAARLLGISRNTLRKKLQ